MELAIGVCRRRGRRRRRRRRRTTNRAVRESAGMRRGDRSVAHTDGAAAPTAARMSFRRRRQAMIHRSTLALSYFSLSLSQARFLSCVVDRRFLCLPPPSRSLSTTITRCQRMVPCRLRSKSYDGVSLASSSSPLPTAVVLSLLCSFFFLTTCARRAVCDKFSWRSAALYLLFSLGVYSGCVGPIFCSRAKGRKVQSDIFFRWLRRLQSALSGAVRRRVDRGGGRRRRHVGVAASGARPLRLTTTGY